MFSPVGCLLTIKDRALYHARKSPGCKPRSAPSLAVAGLYYPYCLNRIPTAVAVTSWPLPGAKHRVDDYDLD
jgi:hypothetical protein